MVPVRDLIAGALTDIDYRTRMSLQLTAFSLQPEDSGHPREL
jgi:hypothetical protein